MIHQPIKYNKMYIEQSFTNQYPRITKDNNLIYNKNLSKTFIQGFIDKN